jgi:hypothetical protein
MCRPVNCRSCGKTTWSGCGMHVNQVKAGVPASQWCDGRHEGSADNNSSGGFFGKLFGR